MIGEDENDNKPEPEDATHDSVDDFNEDTCDLCTYDFHQYMERQVVWRQLKLTNLNLAKIKLRTNLKMYLRR